MAADPPIIVKEQPQTVVQAGGRVAENIVAGFSGTPSLLLIVILNISMILMAGYFFIQQDKLRAGANTEIIRLIEVCIMNRIYADRERYELGVIDQRRPHGGTNTP